MYLIFVAESDDDPFDLNKEKEGHVSDSSKETLCFFDDCWIECIVFSENRMFLLLSGCLILI